MSLRRSAKSCFAMDDYQPSILFHDWRAFGIVAGKSAYDHHFGGPPMDRAMQRQTNVLLFHLLFKLDTHDPAMAIRVPGIRYLPLYYCFDYQLNAVGYQLKQDGELRLFLNADDPNVTGIETFPFEDFPESFPPIAVSLKDLCVDRMDIDDAYNFAEVFGIAGLSPEMQSAVRERAQEDYEVFYGYRFEDDEEWQPCGCFFSQGRPDSACPNPDCRQSPMKVIAAVPNNCLPGIALWGEFATTSIYFEMCDACHSILATNQDT